MPTAAEKKYATFQSGSCWLRADFHLHTRIDKEFSYSGNENEFVSAYVNGLKSALISVGVVANHNKFNLDEFRALRKSALKEEIFLLPGVELSVNDGSNGIHSIVVFSDDWIENNQDYINQFLNVTFSGKTPAQYENENGRSNDSLIETIKKLEGYHRDFFIVFAHVEDKSGLWHELDGGRLEELSKNEYFRRRALAFQKVRTHDKADKKNRVKVKGWLTDAYPAEVEGSDCKSIEEIGRGKECFLRIGDYNFEAIKFALSAFEDRVILNKPPTISHSRIDKVHFEGGVLNGQDVYFSSGLNSLIGIRGSGKSSILEAIRYALDIPFGEKSRDIDYKRALIAHTLGSGGKVTLTAIDRYGQKYEISRILNEQPEVFVDGKLQPGLSIKETIISKPIYFGQKDLSESGDGFEKDLVEKLIGEKMNDIRQRIESQKQLVIDSAEKYIKLTNLEEQKQEHEHKLQDAEFRLKKFRDFGVAEKFQTQTDFEADERKLKSIQADVEVFTDAITALLSEHEDTLNNHRSVTSKQNIDFFKEYLASFEKILKSLSIFKIEQTKIADTLAALRTKFNDFNKLKQSFLEGFAETRRILEQELKTKGIETLNLEEFPQLQKRIETSRQFLAAVEKQQKQKDSAYQELLANLSELNNLWQKEFQAIQVELNKINTNNSSLTINANFKGDKKSFLAFMQTMFKGSKIREATFASLTEAYSDFGNMYRDWNNVKTKAGSSPEVFESYFQENLKALLTWQVPNQFTINYQNKELKSHSLGQRASALILFVLSQHENDVIIIDQPEDDLDNQTIYEDVIKLIKKLKNETQFIFATHNANFPVLGDAEEIHSCRFADGKIVLCSGSIDSRSLQKEIVDIMEGGEIAFNRRKEIYQLWKPQNLSK